MTNTLNYRAIFHRLGSSRKKKQQSLESETLNFRILIHCSSQQNFKNLKEAISLNVCKTNILVIIDKVVSLRINFLKASVILAYDFYYCFRYYFYY